MPAPVPPDGWRPSRREFLGVVGLSLLAAACTGSKTDGASPTAPASSRPPPVSGSLDDLGKGTQQLSVISGNDPASPGQVRFSFFLSDPQGRGITGGSPQVYAALDTTSKAIGPVTATWYPFTAYQLTGDRSPKSDLPGTYEAVISIPDPGQWFMGVRAEGGGLSGFGTAAQPIAQGLPNQVGTKATSVPTPVATTDAAISEICTRVPVDHMHAISLDDALRSGKPTVVGFATPLLCSSQLCGPVIDEQILASEKFGKQANFIHVEEFLPGPTHTPVSPDTLEGRSPAFKAWKLETEPWVFVIDRDGVIRAAFGPGPSTAAQIEKALTPLL